MIKKTSLTWPHVVKEVGITLPSNLEFKPKKHIDKKIDKEENHGYKNK